LSIWKQLFAEPHKAISLDVTQPAISEGTKLDLAFHVALLAAVHKLNCNRVRDLVMRAFDG
jgi:hypothetical protein